MIWETAFPGISRAQLQILWLPQLEAAGAAVGHKSQREEVSSCPLPLPPLALPIYLISWEKNKEK